MKKNIISILLIIFAIFAIFPQNQEGQGVERYALYIASNLGGEDLLQCNFRLQQTQM